MVSEAETREGEAVKIIFQSSRERFGPTGGHKIVPQIFMQGAISEGLAGFDEFHQHTTSLGNAIQLMDTFAELEVIHRLSALRAPTPVILNREAIEFLFHRTQARRRIF